MAAHQVNITVKRKTKPKVRKNLFGLGKRPDARRTTPAHGGIAHHQGKKRKTPDDRNAEFLETLKPKGKAKKSAGGSVMPCEEELQSGFKRGLSLRDMLGNPASTVAFLKDKARELGESKGGVQRMNLEHAETMVALYARLDDGYDKKHAAWARTFQAAYNLAARRKVNPSGDTQAKSMQAVRDAAEANGAVLVDQAGWPNGDMTLIYDTPDGKGTISYTVKLSGKITKAWIVAPGERRSKRNPAAASAEVFEEFHGFAPSEIVTVTKHIHHHKHLAAAGKLTHLDVWGVDGKGHHISGFKGAFLAFNESKNQLFVEGGDQAVNLQDFGMRSPHELETLGRLTDIGYQTNKTHLGDEGGEAVYVHKFRTTNDNGRHVTVRIARYPDLIYDVRNEQLLFSGGSYEILREGINK